MRTHPIERYQALHDDSAPCLSRAATLSNDTKLELGRGAHLGTSSSANHTAVASQPTGRIAKAANWLHLSGTAGQEETRKASKYVFKRTGTLYTWYKERVYSISYILGQIRFGRFCCCCNPAMKRRLLLHVFGIPVPYFLGLREVRCPSLFLVRVNRAAQTNENVLWRRFVGFPSILQILMLFHFFSVSLYYYVPLIIRVVGRETFR